MPRENFAKGILQRNHIIKMQLTRMKLREVLAKRISLIGIGVSMLIISGCSRCEECQYQGSSETICESEFDTPDQYDDAVSDRESQGAQCTSTGGF